MKSPLKDTDSLTQAFQPSILSPNYTGLKLKFGNEFPNIYGDNLDLGSNYSGINLGGGGGTFGGSAIDLIGNSANKIFGTDATMANGASAAAESTGDGFGARFGANMASPQAMYGVAKGVGGILQGVFGRKKRRKAQEAAEDQYNKMMSQYQNLDTSNLAENLQNRYANMENTMEDLTVNQQQAQFEAQQGVQQRANIMSNLQGAAGGSGIAGLAQAMANQGQIATQRASASIGMQESRNNFASAQNAGRIQQLEAAGAAAVDQSILAGGERSRGLEYQKTGTQLGMSQQRLAAANQAIAQSDAALYGGIGSLVGTVGSAALGGIGG
jgi:hypothetical protein